MHFLGGPIQRRELSAFQLNKPRAAVCTRVDAKAKALVLEPPDDEEHTGICVAKPDTLWCALPQEWSIIGPDGKQIMVEKKRMFIVTTETFDPYHLVADVPEDVEKY